MRRDWYICLTVMLIGTVAFLCGLYVSNRPYKFPQQGGFYISDETNGLIEIVVWNVFLDPQREMILIKTVTIYQGLPNREQLIELPVSSVYSLCETVTDFLNQFPEHCLISNDFFRKFVFTKKE